MRLFAKSRRRAEADAEILRDTRDALDELHRLLGTLKTETGIDRGDDDLKERYW